MFRNSGGIPYVKRKVKAFRRTVGHQKIILRMRAWPYCRPECLTICIFLKTGNVTVLDCVIKVFEFI